MKPVSVRTYSVLDCKDEEARLRLVVLPPKPDADIVQSLERTY